MLIMGCLRSQANTCRSHTEAWWKWLRAHTQIGLFSSSAMHFLAPAKSLGKNRCGILNICTWINNNKQLFRVHKLRTDQTLSRDVRWANDGQSLTKWFLWHPGVRISRKRREFAKWEGFRVWHQELSRQGFPYLQATLGLWLSTALLMQSTAFVKVGASERKCLKCVKCAGLRIKRTRPNDNHDNYILIITMFILMIKMIKTNSDRTSPSPRTRDQ
jgi:hypothetical protein